MRLAPAVVLAFVVSAMGSSAVADTWSAPDPRRDVVSGRVDWTVEPCGRFIREQATRPEHSDIKRLKVEHEDLSVRVTARFADLRKTGNHIAWIDILTPGEQYFLYSERRAGGRRYEFLSLQPEYPNHPPAQRASQARLLDGPETDECGSFAPAGFECDFTSERETRKDRVVIEVPRACLGDPEWVRIGWKGGGRWKGIFHGDTWAPKGDDKPRWTGPYSPRVRLGAA